MMQIVFVAQKLAFIIGDVYNFVNTTQKMQDANF
jgi:hypothetical protein